ncbi:thioredoxin family protein [Polaromonas sp. P1(28)-13]|nr:thioredoxin family protein [Polaromonas sp. P1(28)-13]
MPQINPDEVACATVGVRTVILSYQSFCDPCRSTKPALEALAAEHDFQLVCINQDKLVSPEHAGKLLPSVSVYRDGLRVGQPMRGARTKRQSSRTCARTGF